MYLASEKGKRVLNFCYSWGASIVIIGALFKLLHLPYGNQILFVAMTVEALVFFISAFEKPFNEYHWEEVFPVLKSKNPLDRPDFAHTPMSSLVNSPENTADDEVAGGLNFNLGGKQAAGLGNLGLNVSEEDTKNLSDSITERCSRTNLQDGGTDGSDAEISGTTFGHVREYGAFQPGDPFADRRFRHTLELVQEHYG